MLTVIAHARDAERSRDGRKVVTLLAIIMFKDTPSKTDMAVIVNIQLNYFDAPMNKYKVGPILCLHQYTSLDV